MKKILIVLLLLSAYINAYKLVNFDIRGAFPSQYGKIINLTGFKIGDDIALDDTTLIKENLLKSGKYSDDTKVELIELGSESAQLNLQLVGTKEILILPLITMDSGEINYGGLFLGYNLFGNKNRYILDGQFRENYFSGSLKFNWDLPLLNKTETSISFLYQGDYTLFSFSQYLSYTLFNSVLFSIQPGFFIKNSDTVITNISGIKLYNFKDDGVYRNGAQLFTSLYTRYLTSSSRWDNQLKVGIDISYFYYYVFLKAETIYYQNLQNFPLKLTMNINNKLLSSDTYFDNYIKTDLLLEIPVFNTDLHSLSVPIYYQMVFADFDKELIFNQGPGAGIKYYPGNNKNLAIELYYFWNLSSSEGNLGTHFFYRF